MFLFLELHAGFQYCWVLSPQRHTLRSFFSPHLLIPLLTVSLLLFLVSPLMDQFSAFSLILYAGQHRHCQSCFKQDDFPNSVLRTAESSAQAIFFLFSHFMFSYLSYFGVLTYKFLFKALFFSLAILANASKPLP